MLKRTEIDINVLEKCKDGKTQERYMFEIFLLKVIERLTYAFLIATLGGAAGIVLDFFLGE